MTDEELDEDAVEEGGVEEVEKERLVSRSFKQGLGFGLGVILSVALVLILITLLVYIALVMGLITLEDLFLA